MSVNGGVACCPCEMLIIPVRNVPSCLIIPVSLSQAEVDHVSLEGLFTKANEEVVWLDVAVDEALRVQELYALDL